jgi:glucose-6-phosphate dehydrogenase assembly protein OpcA
MTATLWDTNGRDVVSALVAERRAGGAVASGLALTLVVSADEKSVAQAEEAATVAASAHPLRLLVVVRRSHQADSRLDAEVSVGGRFGPTEAVVMRMWGRLALHPESVVLPLLAPDSPVVTWWHGEPPERIANDPLGVLADRRVTDCARAPDPIAALRQRAVDYASGDTDLAWARTTTWRGVLAAAFDGIDGPPTEAGVVGEADSPSAALLAGWLGSRLGLKVPHEAGPGPGINQARVEIATGDDERLTLQVDRPDGHMATLQRTGHPQRQLPLRRLALGELLAEELRRLDADRAYADALATATGVDEDLCARPYSRQHEWRDPEEARAAEGDDDDQRVPAGTGG